MSDMFTCRFCGDNVPVRFETKMEDGHSVCPECGSVVHLQATLKRNEAVLLTTKHALFGVKTGFSNVTALNGHLAMDRIRADSHDLKEIALNKDEIAEVSACVDKQLEIDPNLLRRYMAYKALSAWIVEIMQEKTLDDKQLEKEVEKYWRQYRIDFCRNEDAQKLALEGTDYKTLKAMIAEIK